MGTLIHVMISEEQFKNGIISFQKCEGIGRLYIKGSEKFSLHTVFATFSFMGTLANRQKKIMSLYLK